MIVLRMRAGLPVFHWLEEVSGVRAKADAALAAWPALPLAITRLSYR